MLVTEALNDTIYFIPKNNLDSWMKLKLYEIVIRSCQMAYRTCYVESESVERLFDQITPEKSHAISSYIIFTKSHAI